MEEKKRVNEIYSRSRGFVFRTKVNDYKYKSPMVASRNVCITLVRKRVVICVVDFTCTRGLLDIRNLCLTYYWNFGELSKITSGISFRGGGWNKSKENVSLWKMLYFMLWFSLSVVWFWESFSIRNASFRISNLSSITLDF